MKAALAARPGVDRAVLVLVGDAKTVVPQLAEVGIVEPTILTQAEALKTSSAPASKR